ncbi:uncharacterized protein loaf [Fopius arisanus]|uniref:Uncharacterized protein loaf n=1 Tax=Fopius arisanus TaxID=64838 RepID=A0A9R1T0D2_9HYME|nr:PREDICTED: uncharacterized protein LOC105264907 [Fopius arisanus]
MSDTSWGSSLCARGVHRTRKRTGNTMIISVVVIFTLGSFCRSVAGEAGKQYKMGIICKNHFLRDLYRKIDGAVLLSQNERNLNCATTFQTHSILQRFMLRFDRLQLDCNDHLYIYDGAHAVSNYKADLSCQNTHLSVGAIYTRTNFVTLKYVTDGWGSETNGFQLVITAVKDERHTCKDFRCTMNMFCIDEDLVCDGVNHCGDGSDEVSSSVCANTEASTILGMQKTWFAVALVFGLLSTAALVTAGILCYCRRRGTTPRHSHNTHNAQMTHPPVSFPYARIKRCERRDANGHDNAQGLDGNTGPYQQHGPCGNGVRANGSNDTTTAGKLAAPCGPQARAQRGPGPPLLPGRVRSHGSDSDISSSQKDEWFV